MKPIALSFLAFSVVLLEGLFAHALKSEACEGLFSTVNYVLVKDNNGKILFVDGREGFDSIVKYDVLNSTDRPGQTLYTGGTRDVQGELKKFEDNYLPPQKRPGWGLVQRRHEGFSDQTRSIWFGADEVRTEHAEQLSISN